MTVAVTTLPEPLLTVLARIGACTGVHTHMVGHVAEFCKLLLTGEALKHLVLPACLLVHSANFSEAFRFGNSRVRLCTLSCYSLRLPSQFRW